MQSCTMSICTKDARWMIEAYWIVNVWKNELSILFPDSLSVLGWKNKVGHGPCMKSYDAPIWDIVASE